MEPTRTTSVGDLIVAMRPKQWAKNSFVFAALLFAQRLGEPGDVARVVAAFGAFCLLSSAVYLINDLADRASDRLHPIKRRRPIAAGRISVRSASVAAFVLALVGLVAGVGLGKGFAAVAAIYLLMNLAYSLALKKVVILDVMLVAAGFLLRAWAGAVVIDVAMSHWLVLCTGLIALFLGFVKRRQEIVTSEQAEEQRPILREYSLPFLDQMISVVTASTLLAYSLYTFSPEVTERLGTHRMGLTIPFVLFGLFRYLYLVHQRGEGDNPTQLVLSDLPLLGTILLWGAMVVLALYVLH